MYTRESLVFRKKSHFNQLLIKALKANRASDPPNQFKLMISVHIKSGPPEVEAQEHPERFERGGLAPAWVQAFLANECYSCVSTCLR